MNWISKCWQPWTIYKRLPRKTIPVSMPIYFCSIPKLVESDQLSVFSPIGESSINCPID